MRSILVTLIICLAAATHAAPPPSGHDALAKQRALQLERLHAYRLAGQFASYDDGRPASMFRDARGRLCPMAYLIAASGRMDLVDKVARENNRLQLADVTEGPLWDWMLTSGLTREEIIRIQGAARFGYDLELPRERPVEHAPIVAGTAIAPPPSAARLRREMIRRLETIERDYKMTTDVSLAVATSRLPQTAANVAVH